MIANSNILCIFDDDCNEDNCFYLLVPRCNASHSCEYFLNGVLARSLDDTWSRPPGCHSLPFFNILIENLVLDELHLMRRITDRLEEGLILDILKWDSVSKKYYSNRD